MHNEIYLDHHSATPFLPNMPSYKEVWGDADTYHNMGQKSYHLWQHSQHHLAQFFQVKETDAFMAIGKEEAIWSVFLTTYLHVSRETGKTVWLSNQHRESSVMRACQHLEKMGCMDKLVSVNEQGQITIQSLEKELSRRVALVYLPWADGLTGVIHPVEELISLCHAAGAQVMLDASYLVGKRFFRWEDICADYIYVDGAVIGADSATGLLWTKGGYDPVIQPRHQGKQLAELLFAMGVRQEQREHFCMEIARLRDRLEEGIVQKVPFVSFLFQDIDRLPNHSVMAFPGVDQEALCYLLNERGLYASFGGGKFPKLWEVIKGIGMPDELARSALCFSLSCQMKEMELDKAIELIAESVYQAKTFWEEG